MASPSDSYQPEASALYSPLDEVVLNEFRELWRQTWFLHEIYSWDLDSDVLSDLENDSQAAWFGRASWLITTMTGGMVTGFNHIDQLVRSLLLHMAGRNFRRLVGTAFELTGRRVDFNIERDATVTPWPTVCNMREDKPDWGIEATEPVMSQFSTPVYTPDRVVNGGDIVMTRFLETVPISPSRPCDHITLGLPRFFGSLSWASGLVEGLHPPTLCQLCDRLRSKTPVNALTQSDKAAIFVLHLSRWARNSNRKTK